MKVIDFYENRTNLLEVAQEAADAMERGEVVVYPTDTVYGFGCDAENVEAIKTIKSLKVRDSAKPLSVIMENVEMIKQYVHFDAEKEKIMSRLLPGKFTIVLPLKGSRRLPPELTGGSSNLGVRIPDYDLTAAIGRAFGKPYVSTSVNVSGEPPEIWGIDIVNKYQKHALRPDLIIDAGKISETPTASTVVDLTGKQLRITRTGAVTPMELLRLLSIGPDGSERKPAEESPKI